MKPPVDVLAGFLGSGKTTLLRHAMEQDLEGKRIAVVMNEIGAIGLEGKVITGLDFVEEMVELSGGCICCSIPNYRFAFAMQELVDKARPHLIIIETTGIADPFELVDRLHQMDYPVDGVTTVVDAANFLDTLEVEPVGRAQVAAADFIVLNKCDLVDENQLAKLERKIRRINRRAIVTQAIHGEIDHRLIFGLGGQYWREWAERHRKAAPKEDHDGAKGGVHDHHDHNHVDDHLGIGAFVWSSDKPLSRKRFEKVMSKLPPEVYRAKGLVTFAERQSVFSFNYVAGRLDISLQSLDGFNGVRSVFIGRRITERQEKVEEQLKKCVESR